MNRLPPPLRGTALVDKVGTMLAVRVASTAVSKRIDIEDASTIFWTRIVFLLVQVASIAVFFYCLRKAQAKNDRTVIKTKPSKLAAKVKSFVLQTATGKPQPEIDDTELVSCTVVDYDTTQAKVAIQGIVRSVLMMGTVAVVLGWNKWLIAPCISQPVATVRHALFQLHVLNAAPVGSLSREATPEQVAAAEAAKKAKAKAMVDKLANGEKVSADEGGAVDLDEKAALNAEDVVPTTAPIGDDVAAAAGAALRQRKVVEVL